MNYIQFIQKNFNIYANETKKFMDKYKNIKFIGRLGLYKYFDMDQVILNCMNLCKELKGDIK